ncbi:PcfJ domain-containing protein [Vibrio coralliirubri]|uniref:PcfJ domain-containing protein n=1 Tax=Vibrio coralliirubri TaxID=1516159 RepID=UPI002FCEDC9F
MTALLTIPTRTLGFDYDIEIRDWSQKLVGFHVFEDGRRPLDGGIGLSLNLVEQFDVNGRWLDSLPARYREITDDFPEYQYQMLWLAANTYEAAQLLELRPVILALICMKYSVDNQKALALSRLGQKKILTKLGLDGSKATLKFIDKLELHYNVGDELDHIVRILEPLQRRVLKFKHYSKVGYTALRLDQVHPFLTGSRLGIAMVEEGRLNAPSKMAMFQDAILLGQDLEMDDPLRAITSQNSFAMFEQLHDRWTEQRQLRRLEGNRPMDKDIPYPVPLLGNDNIHPLTDYYDLEHEGIEQKHCIGVYHNRIMSDRYVVFRMLKPQRLTIGLRRVPSKAFPFEIDQICGKRNAPPSESSRQVIHDWLEASKQKYPKQ